jgi:hypothetical protein
MGTEQDMGLILEVGDDGDDDSTMRIILVFDKL